MMRSDPPGRWPRTRPPTAYAMDAYARAVHDGASEADAVQAGLHAEQAHMQRECFENSQYWVDRLAHLEAIKPPGPIFIPLPDPNNPMAIFKTIEDLVKTAAPKKPRRRRRHKNA